MHNICKSDKDAFGSLGLESVCLTYCLVALGVDKRGCNNDSVTDFQHMKKI